jgi:hypothetical protein
MRRSINMTNTPDFAEMTQGELSQLDLTGAPTAVLEAVDTARSAVTDTLAVADQLTADKAELDEKRDLIPLSGLNRLRDKAETEAKTKLREAEQKFERAYQAAENTLIAEAQPLSGRPSVTLRAEPSLGASTVWWTAERTQRPWPSSARPGSAATRSAGAWRTWTRSSSAHVGSQP